MSYAGGEDATPDTVRRYLAENYANADTTPLSEEDLDSLLAKYADLIADAGRAGSFAYFVGDQIAQRTALTAPDTDEDDDRDEQP
jgi:hypothetical protein